MLFISILLSVWFVIWLMRSVYIKDLLTEFMNWVDEPEDEKSIDALIQSSESNCVYHLSCDKCDHLWWSVEPFPNYCPNCGAKRENRNNSYTQYI